MLEDIPFLIRSDHAALERKLMKSAQEPPLLPRQTRWIERLMPYAYKFEYIKGSNNLVADALSRCPYMLNTVTVVHSMLAGILARMKIAATQDVQYQQEVLDILRTHPRGLEQEAPPTASSLPPLGSPPPRPPKPTILNRDPPNTQRVQPLVQPKISWRADCRDLSGPPRNSSSPIAWCCKDLLCTQTG